MLTNKAILRILAMLLSKVIGDETIYGFSITGISQHT
jgi:hypothetical protein